MEPTVTEIPVDISDGTSLIATLTQPPDLTSDAPVVVCFAAMGVRASYYRPLAEAFCRQGLAAVTVDLRGLGASSVRASRRCDFGYREIVELDYPAIFATVRKALPGRKIFALGHSLGGQLACLFAASAPDPPAGIVLVASCSIYFRAWSFPASLFVLLFAQTANLSARILGFFPGYLVNFGDREARRLVRDWSFQGRTGRYEVAGSRHNFETLLATLKIPVLAISFTDDGYSPERAVQHLLGKMPRADTSHEHLPPEQLGSRAVGHFGWIKRADHLAPRIHNWLAASLGLEPGT